MAGGESKGLRRYDKENLLWQSSLTLLAPGPAHEVQKRYVKICESMQEELFSRYGELFEIWFDGGILAPEKGGPDILPIIEKHQPNAILFQGPAQSKNNIRWIGNERGIAPYPCWATGHDITQSDGVNEARGVKYSGTPEGRMWMPGECDVPLGHNKWFCTTSKKKPYWSKEYLASMYDRSVGRNCNLLLNAAPQPDGLIKEEEMEIYREFGRIIKGRYENLLAKTEGEGDKIELAIPKDKGPINQVVLMERIERGERVREFALEAQTADGAWKRIYKGSCIGHKHIVRFEKTEADRLRLSVVKSADTPLIRHFSAYCN